jgi:hypothetical protein
MIKNKAINEELYRETAVKFNITLKEAKEVVQSQFVLLNITVKQMEVERFRLPYIGNFRLKKNSNAILWWLKQIKGMSKEQVKLFKRNLLPIYIRTNEERSKKKDNSSI